MEMLAALVTAGMNVALIIAAVAEVVREVQAELRQSQAYQGLTVLVMEEMVSS
jgi:hypothetical protein